MAKLVMYSPYMKPNDKKHLSRYVSYIATRENVEFAENTEKYKPATPAQQKLVDELLGAYPDVRGSLEFADYSGSPTVGNAHELIDYALDNFVRTSGAEADAGAYVKYIAERPRVEKLSSHGLFSDAGKVINLAAACEETANCGSNVWTHIISLKREDAERLGYDAADSWVQLLRAHRDDIAGAMHIVPANFRWYAAFHNEKHHPHVHMVAYSVKPSEAWLNTDGIEKIKSVLANDIFRDEMDMVYQQKSARRQEVKRTSAFVFQRIMSSINTGTFNNPALENNIADLADKLKNVKGKKQYGYLPANVKKLVDDVADELAKDKRIDDLYDLWYGEKYKSVALYTDTMPDKEPLSQNREFKSIKNMIINEILDIGNLVKNCALPDVVNDEAADNSNMAADFGKLPDREFDAPLAAVNKKSYMGSCYKEAKELLKAETVTFDIGAAAADLFKESAELGSSVAAYQLGKLYLYGAGEFPADVDKGIEWLDKAAAGNNQWAEYLLGKIYLQGKLAQRDPARAEELLKRACAHDNKFAQYLLGNTYLKGEPLQQNVSAGIDLLQKAAKQGCTPANYRLGKLLYEGKEVKQDISKAIDNLKQAAAKDNIYADYLLAKIYLTESSVRDIGAAINHLKRTAETAQPKDKQQRTMRGFAQYQLGKLYYFGTDGMEKNEQLGLEYLTAAAAAGNQSAAQMLTSIQQHRQTAAAMCSLNLMQNVANLITEKTMAAGMQYNHGQSDRREMSKIIDKKLAQGLKTG